MKASRTKAVTGCKQLKQVHRAVTNVIPFNISGRFTPGSCICLSDWPTDVYPKRKIMHSALWVHRAAGDAGWVCGKGEYRDNG